MKTPGYIAAALLSATLLASPVLAEEHSHDHTKAQATQDSGQQTQQDAQQQQEGQQPPPPPQVPGEKMTPPGQGRMMTDSKMMMERHQTMQDILGMLKETMAVVRDMSHKPTAAQKKQLDENIKKLDGIMKQQDEMMKNMMEMMKKRKDMMNK